MRAHPGLTIEFDCRGWNTKNLDQLLLAHERLQKLVEVRLRVVRTNLDEPFNR